MQNKDMVLVTDSGCVLLSDYANTDSLLVVRQAGEGVMLASYRHFQLTG